jgi:haloalkane dehalogenase
MAGPRRFPMLVPITTDDPEREINEAAWKVLEGWHKPFLTLWGTQCPFTFMNRGRAYRTRIPGASLPGIEHKVYGAGHYIQEDFGPEIAADMIAFIEAFPVP